MSSLTDAIMSVVDGDGRGSRVYRANDFARLGSPSAVWQALARLTKAGKLRRVARGLYDYPRRSTVLDADVPPNIDAVAKAFGAVASDDMAAANALGLTNAVLVRPTYLTAGPSRTVKIGNTTIELRHAPDWLLAFRGTPAMPIVQALRYVGPQAANDVLPKLKGKVTPDVADALRSRRVVGWLDKPVRQLAKAA